MPLRTTLTFAAVMLSASSALACQHANPVVALEYTVSEQVPERVEATITNPVEKLLVGVPRLADLRSISGHGLVSFELQFEGGATADDLAVVKERIDAWRVEARVDVLSTKAVLTTSCLNRWPWDGAAPHRQKAALYSGNHVVPAQAGTQGQQASGSRIELRYKLGSFKSMSNL